MKFPLKFKGKHSKLINKGVEIMDEHKNEIELIDFLNIIWKRKWLILILTSFFILATGVIGFLLPPKWEIDAILVPSKLLVQTELGQLEEVVVVDPKQIAGQINQEAYNNLIATELKLNIEDFPKLRAENLQDTNLVHISIKEKDVEKAKLILNSLFNRLKKELDYKVEIEMKGIEEEIKVYKKKLTIIRQRKKEIEQEMNNVKKRIEVLEEEQRIYLKKKNRSDVESLAMLLYSTTIQQNLMNHNTLKELLVSKKIEEENINLEIENKGKKIKQIDLSHLIKEPTSSLKPVSPKKTLNILIAGILGLIIFTLLAFFLEYLEIQREKG